MTTSNINHSKRRVASRTVEIMMRVLLLGLLAAIIAAITILIAIPWATGAKALTVLTGSMTPEIPVGSVVLVGPVDPQSLEVGDVATYQKESGQVAVITHRIVEIDRSVTPATFTFKGDANNDVDLRPVSAEAIRGEVWFHVPYLGAIRDALHGVGGLILLAIIAVGCFAISQLVGAFSTRRGSEDRDDDAYDKEAAASESNRQENDRLTKVPLGGVHHAG